MNKQKVLIATHNKGKLSEIKHFLSDLPIQLVSLSDLHITEDVEENGKTYKENSVKKALFFAKLSGLPTVADDGGLEISALHNEPGVRSRRWLGYPGTDEELIKHMLKISKELPDSNRTAFFKVALSFSLPNGRVWTVNGEIEGVIAKKPHMKVLKGYPYRSFFYLPKLKKYYHESELTPHEQKTYNHRYKAIEKLRPIIQHVILSETKNL